MKKKAKFKAIVHRDVYRQEEEAKLLEEVLALDSLSDANREAFEELRVRLEDGYLLTEKQKKWALGLLDKPTYANEWSAGKIPRGREVATPAVLLRRPLKPPGKS
jgi:hypothetical protein